MKCPYCRANMRLKDASEVYNRPRFKGKMWVCENFPECDSYVSCHEGTTIPKGRPANGKLRSLKKQAHIQFDAIWKCGLMTREDAYKWLADMLNISYDECHIGRFDVRLCEKTIYLSQKQENRLILDYRRKKGIERYTKELYTTTLNK